jgi:galactose mutarotase-like enzyme
MINIKNEFLSLTVQLDGGAMWSLVDLEDNEELLFDGDASIWDKHDAVLFPFVGRQKDGYYEHNGKRYDVKIHGLAPYQRYDVKAQTENSITLGFSSNAETFKVYPFAFDFFITYTLVGKSLTVKYAIKNKSDEEMYFYVGGHPALKVDGAENNNDDTSGNFLDFCTENNSTYTLENNFIAPPEKIEGCVELKKDVFVKYPSLVLDRRSDTTILKRKNGKSVKVQSTSPIICVWADDKRGAFVAVECWWGLPDYWHDTERELKNKRMINSLKANCTGEYEYKLEFINKQEI